MKYKKWVMLIALGLVAAVVAIGAINIGSVSAAISQEDEPSDIMSLKGALGRGIGGYSKADLAAALGITEEELSAAIQAARIAAIDQGVEQGLITQAQADELKSSESASRLERVLSKSLSESGINYEALLADALGINVDELQTAYQEAVFARIDQALADGKLTDEQALLAKGRYALRADSAFQTSMKSAYEAAVQEAVENGVITQEQADLILENTSLKEFGGIRGLSGLFGFDSKAGRPGHGERGAFQELTETDPTTEP